MVLRRRPRELAKRLGRVGGDAVAIEQQLAIGRLRVGMPRLGRQAQKCRALLWRTREARGDLVRSEVGQAQVVRRQKPTFTVPNTVRPAAIAA